MKSGAPSRAVVVGGDSVVTVDGFDVDAGKALVVVGPAVVDTAAVAVVAVFWFPVQATTSVNASDHTALRIRAV